MEWSSNLDSYWPCLRRRIKSGRGMGSGAAYKPWLVLREKPGKGTTGVPLGIKTDRRHQLRTPAAQTYFFLLERQEDVIDIQEIYPILDLEATLKLCGKFDIEHEYDELNPEPFLIDFVVTRSIDSKRVVSAHSLDPTNGKRSERQEEQFRIQYEWCKSNGIGWAPVDVSDFTATVHSSLIHLRGWERHRYAPEQSATDSFVKLFWRVYKPHHTLKEALEQCSIKGGESFERCDNHFRYAAWANAIKVDISKPVILNQPVVLLERP